MATNFSERFRQERQSGTTSSNSFASRFSSEFAPTLAEARRRREEQEIEKENAIREQQQEAINKFKERQEIIQKQLSEGNILEKAKGGFSVLKDFLGKGETLPEIQGGSSEYQKIREEIQKSKEQKADWSERLKGVGKSVVSTVKQKGEEYQQSVKDKGSLKTKLEVQKGAIKNVGELAAGTGKLALEFSPLTGFSGIRKLTKLVGGEEISEYVDRNTPEYLKKVDAFIDNNGVLNYKPKYANEIQKTGGDVAEIGSWFIPITRLGKISKIEKAIAELPKVAKVLGSTPKIVKVGGDLMYEVSKDVVDVGLLDAIRGKDWESIKDDMKMAGIGGTVLRSAGIPIGKALSKVKENKIIKSLDDGLGLDDEEKAVASVMIKQGKATDDIATEIIAKREQAGKNIYKEYENPNILKTSKLSKEAANSIENEPNVGIKKDSVARAKQEIEDGTAKPIRVRYIDGKPHIEDGRHRLQAYKEMGIDEVPIEDVTKQYETPKVSKPETKPAETPKQKIPQKPAKAASDINTRLAKSGFKQLSTEELAGYTPITKEKSIRKVAETMEDYDKSIRMALGRENIPNDVERQVLFNAVVNRAVREGDHELLEALARSPIATERSLLAQKLGSAGYNIDKTSTIANIQDVVKTRTENVTKKMGKAKVDKELKQVRTELEKKVKKAMPTKEDWNKFISDIQC